MQAGAGTASDTSSHNPSFDPESAFVDRRSQVVTVVQPPWNTITPLGQKRAAINLSIEIIFADAEAAVDSKFASRSTGRVIIC